MGKQKPLEYEFFEVVERTDPVGTWKMHTTVLDQAVALSLLPSSYRHDARIVVMHRDLTVRVPFHPPAQRCSFTSPPSRRPKGRGEDLAYLYAHPVYGGDGPCDGGFAQHVRWRALGKMFDLFTVLNGYESHERGEQLQEATEQYVWDCTQGGPLMAFDHRSSQFEGEHPGWTIGWSGRSGGYFVLVPHHQHPKRWGYEQYWSMWSGEIGQVLREDLEDIATVLYDFDLVCCDIIYDVITEGHLECFGDGHIVPLGFK